MKTIVKTVKTSLSIGGTAYPVSSYNMNLSMNALPQLGVRIPMGDEMGAEGMSGSPVDIEAIEEGQAVIFVVSVGDQDVKFEGVIKSASLSVDVSNTTQSKGTYNITAEHKLTYLGGLAIKDRIYVGEGKPAADIIDSYRDWDLRSSTSENLVLFQNILSGSFKNDAMLGLIDQAGTDTIPGIVIKVIKALYESETSYKNKEDGVRELDTKAIAQLRELAENVIGGVPNKDITTVESRSLFVIALLEGITGSWGSSNGLDLLMRSLNSIFFAIMPQQDGSVILKQKCPVYAVEDYTISNSDILNIASSSRFSATPVDGIRLNVPSQDNNAHATIPAGTYIVYPPEGASGLYEYIDTRSYDMWMRFASIYDKQKETNKNAPAGHTGNNEGKDIVEQQKTVTQDDINKELDAIQKANLQIGKAVYALKKWQNSGIVLEVAWTPSINIGDVVKIDIREAKALAANIPAGVYYGYVEAVSFSGSPGSVDMNINVTNVRSEADNKEFGFEELPIYEPVTEETGTEAASGAGAGNTAASAAGRALAAAAGALR